MDPALAVAAGNRGHLPVGPARGAPVMDRDCLQVFDKPGQIIIIRVTLDLSQSPHYFLPIYPNFSETQISLLPSSCNNKYIPQTSPLHKEASLV